MKIIFRLSYNCSPIDKDQSGGHEFSPLKGPFPHNHVVTQLFHAAWVQLQTQTPDPL